MAYTEPFLYFVEYIFGKYAAKLYLCSQIQQKKENKKKKRLIITFETNTAPLKLDIKGKACGIPGRTIPLPSVISAGCGLAWRAELSDRECLIAFMKEHDIRWPSMPGSIRSSVRHKLEVK